MSAKSTPFVPDNVIAIQTNVPDEQLKQWGWEQVNTFGFDPNEQMLAQKLAKQLRSQGKIPVITVSETGKVNMFV